MSSENAPRDANYIPATLFEKDGVPGEVMAGQIDPATGRILVDVPGGTGTVTDVSVVSSHGFAGTVATADSTPAITLSTTVTGIVKGDGTSLSAATAGTDYTALAFKTLAVSGQSDVVADSAADTLTLAAGSNITLTTNAGTDTVTFALSTSPTLVTPALGTPTSGTLTNCTLPVGGITGLAANVATFLATPSSANLIAAVTDETGSGALVFGSSPTITTPVVNQVNASSNTSVKVNAGLYTPTQSYSPAGAGTATLDLALGNVHFITLPAGNITIALSHETVGQCFMIRIFQDSVGSRTVTWFTTIKWAGGSAPTLTTTASKADMLGFVVTSAGNYDGFVVGQNI